MSLMVEKGIRGGICCPIYRYAKANNKLMKDNNKYKELSYFQYWGVNNLYGWAMSQNLQANNFELIKDTSQFNEDFIPKRMKIEKVEKLVVNLHDKTEDVIHIKNLKQTFNHGLVLKKVHRVIRFN